MCSGDIPHCCMCARKTISPVHTTSLRAYSLYRRVTGWMVEMFPLLKSVYLSSSATDCLLYKELLCKCKCSHIHSLILHPTEAGRCPGITLSAACLSSAARDSSAWHHFWDDVDEGDRGCITETLITRLTLWCWIQAGLHVQGVTIK